MVEADELLVEIEVGKLMCLSWNLLDGVPHLACRLMNCLYLAKKEEKNNTYQVKMLYNTAIH